MTAANRGKYAEGEVKKHLDRLASRNHHFTFNRNQDAHSAGGHMSVPQAGDFQAFAAGTYVFVCTPEGVDVERLPRPSQDDEMPANRNFIVEVKEVKHECRLPYKNYSADKIARINVRCLAGTEAIVLICHMPEKKWCAVPQAFFNDRDPAKPSGSWDLSPFPFVDYKTALNEFMGVSA